MHTLPQCMLAMRMPDSMKWQMVWKLMTAKDKDRWGGLWAEWRCASAAARGAMAGQQQLQCAHSTPALAAPAHSSALLTSCCALLPASTHCTCREQYEYVMVADDDLIMDACVINTVFEVRPADLPKAAWHGSC